MTTPHPSIGSWFRRAAVPLMLAFLAACANPFQADVKHFSAQLPPPAGQSFAIVAEKPELAGGIEFGQYAQLVSAQLAKLGYVPADPSQAALLVHFDYGVDKGREKLSTTSWHDPYWGPWYGYRGGFGGFRGRWGYGWQDPWFGDSVTSYTVYTSGISIRIDSKADGKRYYEGKAQAVSTSNNLQYLVPNLIEAIFKDFPGESGQTVRITIAPEKK